MENLLPVRNRIITFDFKSWKTNATPLQDRRLKCGDIIHALTVTLASEPCAAAPIK